MWEIDEKNASLSFTDTEKIEKITRIIKKYAANGCVPKNASSIAATQLSQIQTNYEKRGCIFSDFSIIHSD